MVNICTCVAWPKRAFNLNGYYCSVETTIIINAAILGLSMGSYGYIVLWLLNVIYLVITACLVNDEVHLYNLLFCEYAKLIIMLLIIFYGPSCQII